MERWKYEGIDFEECATVSETIEKYLSYKKNAPSEFMPCLDWWFFSHIADNISHDLYPLHRQAFEKVLKTEGNELEPIIILGDRCIYRCGEETIEILYSNDTESC